MRKLAGIAGALALLFVASACDTPFTPGGPGIGHSPTVSWTCNPSTQEAVVKGYVENNWSGVWNDTEYVMHVRSFGWNLDDDPQTGETLYDYTISDDLYLNPGIDPEIDDESTGDSFEVNQPFPYAWEGIELDLWLEVGWIPVGGGPEQNIDFHEYEAVVPDCTP